MFNTAEFPWTGFQGCSFKKWNGNSEADGSIGDDWVFWVLPSIYGWCRSMKLYTVSCFPPRKVTKWSITHTKPLWFQLFFQKSTVSKFAVLAHFFGAFGSNRMLLRLSWYKKPCWKNVQLCFSSIFRGLVGLSCQNGQIFSINLKCDIFTMLKFHGLGNVWIF